MSNQKYNWNRILQHCADLIVSLVCNQKKVPQTFPQLYRLFQKRYKEQYTEIPAERVFIRKMREEMNVEYGKKSIRSYLLKFVGMYGDMSLELLEEGTVLSEMSDAFWLFIQMKRKDKRTVSEINSHFYHLSRNLKKQFPQEIVFISFDTDTLVILCRDAEAKKKLQSHFHSIKQGQLQKKEQA